MGPRRQGLVEPGSTKGLITFTSSDAEEIWCTRSSCPWTSSMRFTDALLRCLPVHLPNVAGEGFGKLELVGDKETTTLPCSMRSWTACMREKHRSVVWPGP